TSSSRFVSAALALIRDSRPPPRAGRRAAPERLRERLRGPGGSPPWGLVGKLAPEQKPDQQDLSPDPCHREAVERDLAERPAAAPAWERRQHRRRPRAARPRTRRAP